VDKPMVVHRDASNARFSPQAVGDVDEWIESMGIAAIGPFKLLAFQGWRANARHQRANSYNNLILDSYSVVEAGTVFHDGDTMAVLGPRVDDRCRDGSAKGFSG